TPYGAQVILCSSGDDAQSLREFLDDWADPEVRAGNTLLYWAGHGYVANDELWLVTRSTNASRLTDASAVPARSLATFLRRDWERRAVARDAEVAWTVVILDCCGAGLGVTNLVGELASRPADEPR